MPRYLSLFGELVLEMLAESEEAQVAHIHCRTGYPDRGIALKLSGAHVIGVDKSTAAIELARAKAATMPEMVSEYRVCEDLPSNLPSSAFSHAHHAAPASATPTSGTRCSRRCRACSRRPVRPSWRCPCAAASRRWATCCASTP